jgi:hemerythrin-like domain-containing protein
MAASVVPAFFDDHQAIRPRLRTLERALDAAMNRNRAEAADIAIVREALAFLRTAGFDHLRREEEALLPVLEAKVGRVGTLVSVIAYDHDEIRREVGKLAEALAALEARGGEPHGAELRELNRHGIFLVQYMALHMAKEDAFLADAAREALGEDGLADVARRLEGMR